MADTQDSAPEEKPKDTKPLTIVDAREFRRLKKWSVLTYRPVNPDASTLIVWGNFDTLLEAVNYLNKLHPSEKELCYIMKNVKWKTEVSEVDDPVTDLVASYLANSTEPQESAHPNPNEKEVV